MTHELSTTLILTFGTRPDENCMSCCVVGRNCVTPVHGLCAVAPCSSDASGGRSTEYSSLPVCGGEEVRKRGSEGVRGGQNRSVQVSIGQYRSEEVNAGRAGTQSIRPSRSVVGRRGESGGSEEEGGGSTCQHRIVGADSEAYRAVVLSRLPLASVNSHARSHA